MPAKQLTGIGILALTVALSAAVARAQELPSYSSGLTVAPSVSDGTDYFNGPNLSSSFVTSHNPTVYVSSVAVGGSHYAESSSDSASGSDAANEEGAAANPSEPAEMIVTESLHDPVAFVFAGLGAVGVMCLIASRRWRTR